MVILLIVAIVVLYAGLARFMARDNGFPGSRGATPLPGGPEDVGTAAGGVPAAGRDVEQQATWTALDDIQLNRLLEESS